jgi:hypothetical protein
MNTELRPELTDLALAHCVQEIGKLQELAVVCCEREHFQAMEILKRYLDVSNFITDLHRSFDVDETWLMSLEQSPTVTTLLDTIRSTRQSLWQMTAAIECRLISAGALHMPSRV